MVIITQKSHKPRSQLSWGQKEELSCGKRIPFSLEGAQCKLLLALQSASCLAPLIELHCGAAQFLTVRLTGGSFRSGLQNSQGDSDIQLDNPFISNAVRYWGTRQALAIKHSVSWAPSPPILAAENMLVYRQSRSTEHHPEERETEDMPNPTKSYRVQNYSTGLY